MRVLRERERGRGDPPGKGAILDDDNGYYPYFVT